jgi:dienelactone hydrolase
MRAFIVFITGFLLSHASLASNESLRELIAEHHYAYVPNIDGRLPTLIAMPGCSGIASDNSDDELSNPGLLEVDHVFRRHFRDAAEKLKDNGFVVLLVDIQAAEGLLTACGGKIENERLAVYVNEAVAWARELPFVDPDQMHLIGWSMGGRAVLRWLHGPRSEAATIRSTIAVYPGCSGLETLTTSMPILMLLGGSDDIADPMICESLASSAPIKEQIIIENYPGARHGFDVLDAPPVKDIGNGMTIGYQPEAAEAAWQAILRFLRPVE